MQMGQVLDDGSHIAAVYSREPGHLFLNVFGYVSDSLLYPRQHGDDQFRLGKRRVFFIIIVEFL